jgi:uncharacterized protein YndB with AHSA1/START domain
MPVKKNPTGERSVEAEVEVPGTVEEVWRAIATGPGISSWFVPSTVEEKVGGAASSNFGPGMESHGTIKTWEPGQRFVVETTEGPGPVATEWIVEARQGGTCVVRVVHRWFASTDDWDKEFEGHTYGWQAFFRILRLYLEHFAGQPSAAFQVMGMSAEAAPEAWKAFTAAIGFDSATAGDRRQSPRGAPILGGVLERVGDGSHPELLLRLDAPGPGIAHFFAMPMGGQVLLSSRLYLYGDQAAQVAATSEPQWQAWINERFPCAQF